jgi:hypothetical protein
MTDAPRPPAYRFRPTFVVRFLASVALGRRRDAASDGREAFAGVRPRPRASGVEHVPATGPCVLVMNHYERPGMRVWWAAWLVLVVIAERRGGESVRWLMTDRFYGYRLWGVPIPERAIGWFLRRVAATYGLLAVSRVDAGDRGALLRQARRLLHDEACVVGITPEAGNAAEDARVLVQPVEGSASAIRWLARAPGGGRVPVVPVAVYDDPDGALVARFGAPLEEPVEDVMAPVARLLPEGLCGPYAVP